MFTKALASVNHLSKGSVLWVLSLFFIVLTEILIYGKAISGDWFSSGNDMQFLIPAIKDSLESGRVDWLWGPWVGEVMFSYYRPVTSLFFITEFNLFGQTVVAWQITSLVLHIASTVTFACLVALWFRNRIAGWVAALVWGVLRARNDLTIEWTPAQTDLLAGFFTIGALILVLIYAKHGSRVALWSAAVAFILAMGAKEAALVAPLLAIVLGWAVLGVNRTRRNVVTLMAIGVLVCFLVLRFIALQGSGFLPGQDMPLSLDSVIKRLFNHLLPEPISPLSLFPPLGGVLFGIAVVSVWFLRSNRLLAFSTFALLFSAGLLLVGQEFILLWSFWQWFLGSLVSVVLFFLCWYRAKHFLVWTVVWGVVAWAPLYHVVYNKAGNVSYLADTYWGLIWACVVLSVIRFMGGKFVVTAPEPIQDSHEENHLLDESTQVLRLQPSLGFHS